MMMPCSAMCSLLWLSPGPTKLEPWFHGLTSLCNSEGTEMLWGWRNKKLFLFCFSKTKVLKHSLRHKRFLTSDEGCLCFLRTCYLVIFRERLQAEVGTPCGWPRQACSFEVSHFTFGFMGQNSLGKTIVLEPALVKPRGENSSSSKGVERKVPGISSPTENLIHTCVLCSDYKDSPVKKWCGTGRVGISSIWRRTLSL